MSEMLKQSRGAALWISALALMISLVGVTTARQAGAQERGPLTREQARALEQLEEAFTAIADAVEPVVVQIKVEAARPRPRRNEENQGTPERPEDFFRQFPFGPNLRPVPPRGAGGTGSGVIVKIDGHEAYILTNAHVVNGAPNDAITVVLQDGTAISGKSKVTVRGMDTKTDLAVLKVITEKPLSPKHYQAKLGDSDKVRVGQWAVAIGSPFGLASTFTVGVISALGRAQTIQDTTYTNFIQTDAAINPGNSGGALVNIRGEVIGINTAIATGGTRSSAGVGFAIPINKAKRVMEQLIATGRVAHGFIGVLVGDLTEDLQQLAKVKEGVFVQDVTAGGPAEKAGIQPEDAIVAFNGKPLRTKEELIELASSTAPGTDVELKIVRKGQIVMKRLKLGELPSEETTVASGAEQGGDRAAKLGLSVEEITPEIAQRLKLPANLKGIVITRVQPGSPAEEAGLRAGDIITRANSKPVSSVDSFRRIVDALKEKELLFVRISRYLGGDTPIRQTIPIKPLEE